MNATREQIMEIVSLAHQVFDFDDWKVIVLREKLIVFPSARPEQKLMYDSIQDCIDDLRFRRLVRFTPFRGFV